MSPACVYTFLFFWRDFSALVVTLVFIRVSGATFLFGATLFYSGRLFPIWRDLVHLALLFF